MQHDRKHNLNADEGPASSEAHSTQHDRRHDLNAEQAGEDHSGERDVNLSARSLAARGDAPDGSEDGRAKSRSQADGLGEA